MNRNAIVDAHVAFTDARSNFLQVMEQELPKGSRCRIVRKWTLNDGHPAPPVGSVVTVVGMDPAEPALLNVRDESGQTFYAVGYMLLEVIA